LARKTISGSGNHRLQTLIGFLGLPQGTAHRATDDAEACLGVALHCMEKLGRDRSLADVLLAQGGKIEWSRFSMQALKQNPIAANLVAAVERQAIVELTYLGGSTPGEARRIHPEGVVRSLDGDYLVAYSEKGQKSKRYLLEKVTAANPV
jgi:DNA polymerase III epsilon subunit-like protein